MEPLVGRARNQTGRSSLLAVRMADSSLAIIDARAERWGMTRADAVRRILSAGIEALDKQNTEEPR